VPAVRHASVAHPRGPRHARRLVARRALRVVALTLTGVLLFGVSAFAALGAKLNSNIHQIDVGSLLGEPAPGNGIAAETAPSDPNAGRAINILVLGSDQRNGANAAIGGADPSVNSDTAIVLHISAGRDRVEAVSIPRDSLVDIPACQGTNGKKSGPQGHAMFNSAFGTGWQLGKDLASAAACTGRTVQNTTGLKIDHFIVVDFSGFQAMVNAVGGVNICIPRALHDVYTGLNLKAGQQTLNGVQALQFARARHGNIGNGGDLDRIGDQQRLIAAIANQVLSANTLANPAKVTSFLSAATSSLTVDSGLNLVTLSGLAYSLRSVRANDITFMTIPVLTAPSDPNRLVWAPAAKTVWANMVADKPIAGADAPASSPSASATPSHAATTPAGTATGTVTAPAATATPAPAQTKVAGQQPFTPADVTAVCK
jgi:LCP family protein required for cell wall assembly